LHDTGDIVAAMPPRECRLDWSGGSRDRTKSPAAISGKREYSRSWPWVVWRLKISETGRWRPAASSRKPAVCDPFWSSEQTCRDSCTGWLGREGSNLRMADSKSAFGLRRGAEAQGYCGPQAPRLPVSSLVSLR
jgi:hypothetical protein